MQTSPAERQDASPAAAAPVRIYRYESSSETADDAQRDERPEGHPDERLLIEAVAHFSGTPASEVVVARHCRRCGADDHGKPYVIAPRRDDGAPIQVSLSRAGGQAAVAVTAGNPIGLDIEEPAALTRASIDAAALHLAEQAALLAAPDSERDDIRTLLWCAKEAVLKATGWGLAVDPSELEFALAADGQLTLETWPSSLELDEAPYLGVVELPTTTADRMLLGVIAVIGERPSDVDLWRI
ncbi:4'-phosphopantetheinyl transferase family protein [Leifsonia sp. A12D58]|uniref:4'-phosphopantetheinyl transferase family protein n=1 Tax=Leifsonia sp. A12D58 TaxID=3397674 RepID=UPI0039E0F26A